MQVYYQRDGQPHAYPFRADALADAARPSRARRHDGARARVECARHRHRHDGPRRRVVPPVASRADARPARRHRARIADGGARARRPAVRRSAGDARSRRSGGAVRNARRRVDGRRLLPHPHGLSDVVRHPTAQSVQLALVRDRSDADRRRLSDHRPRRGTAVRRRVTGGEASECRDRARADGGELQTCARSRATRPSASRRACSARSWPSAATAARDSQALVSVWPRAVDATLPPSSPSVTGSRCLVEIAAMPSFFSPFRWRLIAQMSNAYEMHDVDVLDARLRRPPQAGEAPWRVTVRYPNLEAARARGGSRTDCAGVPRILRFPAARSSFDPATANHDRALDRHAIRGRPDAGSAARPIGVVQRDRAGRSRWTGDRPAARSVIF